MAARGFRWEAPPTRLAVQLDRYDRAVDDGAEKIAGVYAARMETFAKANAPWSDRTGASRQSLTGTTEKSAALLKIWLYGDTPYLPFLETGTRNMRPFPIIWPTIAAHAKPLMDDLRRLVED